MPQLLHIDASIDTTGSTSRAVSATYAQAWREAHPGGTVTYRDLAATPPPHLSWDAVAAAATPEADHTPEQARAWTARQELVVELETADELLLAVPMYNFSIPSTVKAWFDQVIIVGRTAGGGAPDVPGGLAQTKVTVVAVQGGSYRPGTPKDGWDHQQPYLAHALESLGAKDVVFLSVEMALSPKVPALAEFIGLFEQSRAAADAAAKARAAA